VKVKRDQTGYMLEVPVIVMVVGVGLAVLVPQLPPRGQKIAVMLGALILIACAYYMIVIPGWQPGATRLRAPWNLIVFSAVAALLAFGAGAFAFH
jgi:type II secretory pathway component PulM